MLIILSLTSTVYTAKCKTARTQVGLLKNTISRTWLIGAFSIANRVVKPFSKCGGVVYKIVESQTSFNSTIVWDEHIKLSYTSGLVLGGVLFKPYNKCMWVC